MTMQKWNTIASNIFLRKSDKSDHLSDSLAKLEQHIDHIKQVCQSVGRKLLACLQLHGIEVDKRLKKLPEYSLSKQLCESAMTFDDKDAFKRLLMLCSEAEEQLAKRILEYEESIESKVLTSLQNLLERDIPAILKLRKQVTKQAQEVDALKSRFATAQRQTAAAGSMQGAAAKLEGMRDEMDDAENKLEQYKDQLAIELFNFYAQEEDLNSIFQTLIQLQLDYHRQAAETLDRILPDMKQIEFRRPVYGCRLEDHLSRTKCSIATVINDCILTLSNEELQQEGLFRIAAGSTKVKKLKAAFDASMVDMDEYSTDPHCIAGALKLYLRELPEPLMTFEHYQEWMQAVQLPSDQRLDAFRNILNKTRKPYYENLKFLIKFLSKLAENSDATKMSSSNLAIVIGPNLIWPPGNDVANILTTGFQSAITEILISQSDLLFPGDVDFNNCSPNLRVASRNKFPSREDLDNVATQVQLSSATTDATLRKVDSSDSLSSDSTGFDSIPMSTTTSSGCTGSLASDDVTTHVIPPRRNVKKSAPMPPKSESASTENAGVALAKEPAVVAVPPPQPATASLAEVPAATHRPPPPSAPSTAPPTVRPPPPPAPVPTPSMAPSTVPPTTRSLPPSSVMSFEQSKSTASIASGDEPLSLTTRLSKSGEASECNVTKATENVDDSVTTKKISQFAAAQALISNVLVQPKRSLFLTRPNTTYMEHAKMELIKAAEEAEDMEPVERSKAAAAETIDVQDAQHQQQQQKASRVKSGSARKTVTGAAESDANSLINQLYTAADILGNLEPDEMCQVAEKISSISKQSRSSEGAINGGCEVRKKPERPMKPSRPTTALIAPADVRLGGLMINIVADGERSKSESGTIKAPPPVDETQETSHQVSQNDVFEAPPAAHGLETASEVPEGSKTAAATESSDAATVQRQISGSGGGTKPPKPPPPTSASIRSSAGSSVSEEDTRL